VPGRAIHDEYGVGATGDFTGDFVDMRLHGFCVHPWRCDSRARSARRANRPEQIGVFVALVGRLAWPRSGSRPLTDGSVLLANSGFIWRGKPLTSRLAVVELIGATTTKKGLSVRCELNPKTYVKGIKVSDAEMATLNI